MIPACVVFLMAPVDVLPEQWSHFSLPVHPSQADWHLELQEDVVRWMVSVRLRLTLLTEVIVRTVAAGRRGEGGEGRRRGGEEERRSTTVMAVSVAYPKMGRFTRAKVRSYSMIPPGPSSTVVHPAQLP